MGAGVRDAFPPPDVCGWFYLRVSFGWIMCKWLFGLCGIAWKNITEMGRGGACVPARVAPARAHPSFMPAWHDDTQMCVVDDMFKIVIECREGTTPSVLYF